MSRAAVCDSNSTLLPFDRRRDGHIGRLIDKTSKRRTTLSDSTAGEIQDDSRTRRVAAMGLLVDDLDVMAADVRP